VADGYEPVLDRACVDEDVEVAHVAERRSETFAVRSGRGRLWWKRGYESEPRLSSPASRTVADFPIDVRRFFGYRPPGVPRIELDRRKSPIEVAVGQRPVERVANRVRIVRIEESLFELNEFHK
jgi:hypothetical protein